MHTTPEHVCSHTECHGPLIDASSYNRYARYKALHRDVCSVHHVRCVHTVQEPRLTTTPAQSTRLSPSNGVAISSRPEQVCTLYIFDAITRPVHACARQMTPQDPERLGELEHAGALAHDRRCAGCSAQVVARNLPLGGVDNTRTETCHGQDDGDRERVACESGIHRSALATTP